MRSSSPSAPLVRSLGPVAHIVAGLALLVACGSSDTVSRIAIDPDATTDAGADTTDALDTDLPDAPAADTADDVRDDVQRPDAADEDAPPIEPDTPPELPRPVTSIRTLVSATTVTAGTSIFITCVAEDIDGIQFPLDPDLDVSLVVSPTTTTDVDDDELRVVARSAGRVYIACAVPSLGLIDPDAASVEVVPGPVHTLVATLVPPAIPAGGFAEVQCDAFDAWGNGIEDPVVTRATDPFGDGVEIEREFVRATRAGLYSVRCDADGAAISITDELDVRPAAPHAISATVRPDAPSYRVGEVVELRYAVTDAYGNLVADAPVTFSSVADVPRFGEGRFRFNAEGTFELFVNSGPLTASVIVIVNSEGPSIECTRPFDGQFVSIPTGAPIVFRGRATDAFGTESVTVQGIPADLADDGLFEVTLPSRFGINFVEIVAEDTGGNRNSRVCSYLASETWSPETAFLADSVTLGLRQGALDDQNRAGPINSLGDVLHAILNSRGLRDTMHNALQASNPLYDQCVQRVCIIGCFCALSASVNHLDTQLNGPNTVALTLVDGGMRAIATVRDTRLRIRIGGTFSTTGWVTFEEITVDITFNTALQGGRPRVTLRAVNSVNVGRIRTDFSGLTGLLVGVIVDLFNGRIRNLVRDIVRDFLRDNFNDALDGIVSGLSIESLGTSFDVPRLEGGGSVRVGFALQFSSLLSNSSRLLFGIGTRFPGEIARDIETLGAPIPPGAVRYEPSPARTVGAGVSLGLLNQALHTLWRAGLFDANITGSLLSGFADDAVAVLRTNLPPVVAGTSGNELLAMLGGVRATVLIPGVIDAPLQVAFGAVASTGADLLPGDVLQFRNIEIRELWFSPLEGSLEPAQRTVLEAFLRDLAQYVIDESLNSALPALPIPGFAIPDDLVTFGLPRGGELGITSPTLFNTVSHFVVEGNFGIR